MDWFVIVGCDFCFVCWMVEDGWNVGVGSWWFVCVGCGCCG